MDENGRLMLKETALKNLVLDFFKTRLKISPENLPKIDMDKIFLPDNFKKSSFEKVHIEFPNVEIVGWIMSHVKIWEGRGRRRELNWGILPQPNVTEDIYPLSNRRLNTE